MKLIEVKLIQFRMFLNQTLKLDPKVTVLVGKNGIGKTSLVHRFFEQCLQTGFMGSADWSYYLNRNEKEVHFETIWVPENNSENTEVKKLLSFNDDIRKITIEVIFSAKKKKRTFIVNNKIIDPIKFPFDLKPKDTTYFDQRNILKIPEYYYMPTSKEFKKEIQFLILDSEIEGSSPRHYSTDLDTTLVHSLFKLTKLQLFPINSTNEIPSPTHGRSYISLSIEELNKYFKALKKVIDYYLYKYWSFDEILNIDFRFRKNPPTSEVTLYTLNIQIINKNGIPRWGDGLDWFLSFIIRILFFIKHHNRNAILGIDEPGAHLHPAAQYSIRKLITHLSDKYQIIYTTHSPFMIDWSFPQRIRLLDQESTSECTKINNKPYTNKKSHTSIWDNTRLSVGVFNGDIGFLCKHNLLVEGISDQIYLSNISEYLKESSNTHLNEGVNIVPFSSCDNELHRLLQLSKLETKNSIVLVDADNDGEGYKRIAKGKSYNAKSISLREVVYKNESFAIEDLFERSFFLKAVYNFYEQFPWFKKLYNENTFIEGIEESPIQSPITSHLEKYFKDFISKNTGGERSFCKVSVCVNICNNLKNDLPSDLAAFERLFKKINGLTIT